MKRPLPVTALLLALLLASASSVVSAASVPLLSRATPISVAQDKRPIELPDILDWKRIGSRALSDDGAWLAYVLSPTEGDSEVVVRATSVDTEYRFAAGEMQGFASARLAFSADSKWLALTIKPNRAAAKQARKSKAKLYDTVGLVDLSTGEMTEIEQVRASEGSGSPARPFALSGHRNGDEWLAVHRAVPESQQKEADKWSGSDLHLRRLADGTTMSVGNVSEYAFNDAGEWLAVALDTRGRAGNGLQLRHLSSGRVLPIDSAEAIYRHISWTEEGDALAVLRGTESDRHEEDLVSVLGVQQLDRVLQSGAAQPALTVFDPHDERWADTLPAGMTINPNHAPSWSDDRDALLFRIDEAELTEEAKADPENKANNTLIGSDDGDGHEGQDVERPQRGDSPGKGGPADAGRIADEDLDPADLVIWHWRDRRLQSRQQVQQERDRAFGYLSVYRVAEESFLRLADDEVRNVDPAPKQRFGIARDNDEYERVGNLDGRRYDDVWVVDMRTGERALALEQVRWLFQPSPSGTHFLYFRDGDFHTYDMTSGTSHNVTAGLPVKFWNEDDDHNVVMPPINPFGLGWSADGQELLLSDGWDIWKIPAEGGEGVNLTANGREQQIRYGRPFRLDPDRRASEGIDLSAPLYVTAYGEWTKKGGIARVDATRSATETLLWDDAAFGNLLKAESADRFLFSRQTHEDFPDLYVADASLADGRRLTDANSQQADFAWSAGTRLVDYTSAKGDKLQGALFLPADYEPGKAYPTVVYIYEKLSQGLNRYAAPTAGGFNKSVYTSNGYAVFMPDIVYQVDDPGMSAVWCVLPALDAAVATGIVDAAAVGLHGHSWGGYQTSFLVTQTDRFRAAIAGAPLTNMISMYSLIYKNSGGGNGAIFESSQGRFTGGPWEVPEAYVRNSPVYHAKNVTSPLMLLHNDKDGAVDFTQGVEYYNTLRRLDKDVVMLQYVGENHGLRKPSNRKDYTVRMREYFDHHLRDLGMPGWLQEGVPYLEVEDHLKARARAIAEQVDEAQKARAADKAGDAGDGSSSGEETREKPLVPVSQKERPGSE